MHGTNGEMPQLDFFFQFQNSMREDIVYKIAKIEYERARSDFNFTSLCIEKGNVVAKMFIAEHEATLKNKTAALDTARSSYLRFQKDKCIDPRQ